MESEDSNCTKKYWESVQEDSDSVSHCFARYYYSWALYYGCSWALYGYYSWALIVLVVHGATGWDWDHVSSGDGFHVMVRLHNFITAAKGVHYFVYASVKITNDDVIRKDGGGGQEMRWEDGDEKRSVHVGEEM